MKTLDFQVWEGRKVLKSLDSRISERAEAPLAPLLIQALDIISVQADQVVPTSRYRVFNC